MVDPIESVINNKSNEVEMRARLDNLNKIAVERSREANVTQTSSQTKNETGGGTSRQRSGDVVRITPEASFIASSGLDKSQSMIRRSGDKLEFHLRFDTDKFSAMTTKGSFSPVSKEMNLFVSFNFSDKIRLPEGKEETRDYNARVKLEATNVTAETFGKLQEQGGKIENIVDNMLGRMLERAYQKQYPPMSVVLKLADIADLVAENGGLFQKVSRAMMLLNSSLARALEGNLSESQTLDAAIEDVLGEGNSIELKDFSFQLKELTPTLAPSPLGTGAGGDTGSLPGADLPPPPMAGQRTGEPSLSPAPASSSRSQE